MQKFRDGRMVRIFNAMREGLTLDYEGKGLLSSVSNERSSHGRNNNSPGWARSSLLTSVTPNREKPVRKRCSFIHPQTESVGLNKTEKVQVLI